MSRIRANQITNQSADGAPTVQHGLIVSGVTTVTGSINNLNLTGITTISTLDLNGDIDVDGHTNLDNVSIAGVSTFSEDVTFTGASANILFDKSSNRLNFADSADATFGNSNDLLLYHNGSHSFVQHAGTGNLQILGNNIFLATGSGSEQHIAAYVNNRVDLYFNNSVKLSTTNTGIQVGTGVTVETNGQATYTGIVTASAFKLSDGSAVGGVESDAEFNTVAGTNAGNALDSDTYRNTLFGYDTGKLIDSGDDNTLIGYDSGKASTSGYRNTAVGSAALLAVTDGANNAAFGYQALDSVTGGARNTAVGKGAGAGIVGANNNTYVGMNAGEAHTAGNNNIVIGYSAALSSTTISNEVVIGNASITRFRIPGIGLDLTSAPPTLANGADNRVVTASSASALNGEANLTFNGSALRVVANDGGADVNFAVRNTNASGYGAYISGGGTGSGQYILRLDNKDQSEKVRFPSTGGISFNGDTAAANALDDYEEGNWTPNLVGLSNTPAFAAQQGKYTKIGRLVNLAGLLQGGGTKPLFTSQTDILKISGVPFAPNGSGYRHAYGSVTWQTTDWYGTNHNAYNYNQGQIAVGMSGSNLSFWISRATHDASGALISYATNKTLHNKDFLFEYNITYMTDA
tara:strand:+ start:914 stop:2815 length:1902 start_codon:yes stop_codon:yes gene_type:complete